MSARIFSILFSFLAFISPTHAQEKSQERADWGKYFIEFNAKGTIVVADERANNRSTFVYDEARAKQRYSPASTYKIPHALMALMRV